MRNKYGINILFMNQLPNTPNGTIKPAIIPPIAAIAQVIKDDFPPFEEERVFIGMLRYYSIYFFNFVFIPEFLRFILIFIVLSL